MGMPKSVQILRASVRSVITYLVTGTIVWRIWNGQGIPTELHQLALLCLAFWFGDKTVRNYLGAKQGLEDRYMTAEEVAQYLGFEKQTIYNKTHNKEIPFYKLGRKAVRFKKAEIDAWVKSLREKESHIKK